MGFVGKCVLVLIRGEVFGGIEKGNGRWNRRNRGWNRGLELGMRLELGLRLKEERRG
jgi:hypothetical protein